MKQRKCAKVSQFFDFFLNFYCSGQTLVNAGLPMSCGIGSELSHSTSNWLGVLIWFNLWAPMVFKVLQCTFGTSFPKKGPIHYKLQNHHFFLNNFYNTQCEDSLPCQDAPMLQIWGHLGNVCLRYGHDPSHLPYLQWTFYPVIHICEEMCESFTVTQVS